MLLGLRVIFIICNTYLACCRGKQYLWSWLCNILLNLNDYRKNVCYIFALFSSPFFSSFCLFFVLNSHLTCLVPFLLLFLSIDLSLILKGEPCMFQVNLWYFLGAWGCTGAFSAFSSSSKTRADRNYFSRGWNNRKTGAGSAWWGNWCFTNDPARGLWR